MLKIIKKKDAEKSVYYLKSCVEHHEKFMNEIERLLESSELSDNARKNLIETRNGHVNKYYAYRDALYEFEKLGLYEP